VARVYRALARRRPSYAAVMPLTRDQVARRAARDLRDGFVVDPGPRMPAPAATHIPEGLQACLPPANGLPPTRPVPPPDDGAPHLINAGKQTIAAVPGAAFFSSSESFEMIRGGHVQLAILGAMQVSEEGDIANWMIPGKMVKGMGGAMDLVAGVRRVIVMMEH